MKWRTLGLALIASIGLGCFSEKGFQTHKETTARDQDTGLETQVIDDLTDDSPAENELTSSDEVEQITAEENSEQQPSDVGVAPCQPNFGDINYDGILNYLDVADFDNFFENQSQPIDSCHLSINDLNGNGSIDFEDRYNAITQFLPESQDINGDGKLTCADVQILSSAIVDQNAAELSEWALISADYDRDQQLTINDVEILKSRANCADATPFNLEATSLSIAKSQELLGHEVFITSQKYSANLGGLEGADELCTSLAAASGRQHIVWKALLSSEEEDAKNRISIWAPIFDTSGEQLWSPLEYLEQCSK